MKTRSIIASAAAMLVAGVLLSTGTVAKSVSLTDDGTKVSSTTKADHSLLQFAQDSSKKGKRKAKGKGKGKKKKGKKKKGKGKGKKKKS